MSLPAGWEDRHNTMSEKDLKLGGMEATKFGSKGAYSLAGSSGTYQTSDQVRAHYYSTIDGHGAISDDGKTPHLDTNSSDTATTLPSGWEQRQKIRQVEAKQYGAFSRTTTSSNNGLPSPKTAAVIPGSALTSLLRVTTFSLDNLAAVLESSSSSSSASTMIPDKERDAFAMAMKKALDALAKHNNR